MLQKLTLILSAFVFFSAHGSLIDEELSGPPLPQPDRRQVLVLSVGPGGQIHSTDPLQTMGQLQSRVSQDLRRPLKILRWNAVPAQGLASFLSGYLRAEDRFGWLVLDMTANDLEKNLHAFEALQSHLDPELRILVNAPGKSWGNSETQMLFESLRAPLGFTSAVLFAARRAKPLRFLEREVPLRRPELRRWFTRTVELLFEGAVAGGITYTALHHATSPDLPPVKILAGGAAAATVVVNGLLHRILRRDLRGLEKGRPVQDGSIALWREGSDKSEVFSGNSIHFQNEYFFGTARLPLCENALSASENLLYLEFQKPGQSSP